MWVDFLYILEHMSKHPDHLSLDIDYLDRKEKDDMDFAEAEL